MDVASLKGMPPTSTGSSTTPYTKNVAVKLCIVKIVQNWTPYTRANGKKSHFLKCYGADSTGYLEIIAYDSESQESILKEGTSVLIKNYIMKDDVMKLTSSTKIFRCEPIVKVAEVPTTVTFASVQDVSTSPTKKLINIVGTVTKEETIKDVMAQSKKTKVKEITVADNTGEVKVALWDSVASTDTKCGKKYKILNAAVKYSSFHGQNTLSLNSMSTIEEIEQEEEKIEAEIIAVNVTDNGITIIINDAVCSEYISSKQVFENYLNIEDNKITEDTIAGFLPIKCKISVKNNMTVTDISDQE